MEEAWGEGAICLSLSSKDPNVVWIFGKRDGEGEAVLHRFAAKNLRSSFPVFVSQNFSSHWRPSAGFYHLAFSMQGVCRCVCRPLLTCYFVLFLYFHPSLFLAASWNNKVEKAWGHTHQFSVIIIQLITDGQFHRELVPSPFGTVASFPGTALPSLNLSDLGYGLRFYLGWPPLQCSLLLQCVLSAKATFPLCLCSGGKQFVA